MSFKIGDRVRLESPEEHGEILDVKMDNCLVALDKQYREDSYDDGLREVSLGKLKHE